MACESMVLLLTLILLADAEAGVESTGPSASASSRRMDEDDENDDEGVHFSDATAATKLSKGWFVDPCCSGTAAGTYPLSHSSGSQR
jgi:hypothetical protein